MESQYQEVQVAVCFCWSVLLAKSQWNIVELDRKNACFCVADLLIAATSQKHAKTHTVSSLSSRRDYECCLISGNWLWNRVKLVTLIMQLLASTLNGLQSFCFLCGRLSRCLFQEIFGPVHSSGFGTRSGADVPRRSVFPWFVAGHATPFWRASYRIRRSGVKHRRRA